MYSKTAKKKPSALAKAGALVLAPATGSAPQNALAAICDGCGAELWILSEFQDKLKEGNHRTFCLNCLLARKII